MATVLRTYAGTDLNKLQDSSDDKLSGSVSLEPVPSLGAPIEEKKRGFLWRRTRRDPDSIATQPSVFDDPATLELYRPPPVYESAHRFDPFARWTWREETVSTNAEKPDYRADQPPPQPLVRKIDLYIMVWAWIMFFALDLDRANISQANTDNFLKDLGMTTNDFNTGNMLFKVSLYPSVPRACFPDDLSYS